MSKYRFLFFLLTLLAAYAHAQPGFEWAKAAGAPGYDAGRATTVDRHGNSYSTGYFTQGTVDFDPGPGVFNLTSTPSQSCYVLKLDSAGNFVWAVLMPSGCFGAGLAITTDTSDNIYITGDFSGTGDFDPGPGVFSMTSTGNFTNMQNVFITKLDPNANFIWAKRFAGGNPGTNIAWCIAVDDSANVYTSGYFQGTVDFDPGAGVYNLSVPNTANSMCNVFISKLNPAGNFVWAKQIQGTPGGYPVGMGIAVDNSGYVYSVGYFQGLFDFDPGPATHFLFGQQDEGYLLRLDPSGNYSWAFSLGSHGPDRVNKIAIDGAKNIYIGGMLADTVDVDPGPGVYNLIASGNSYPDMFVARYNIVGQLIWAKIINGPGSEAVQYLALDRVGDVYALGTVTGTMDFDPGPGTYNLTSAGNGDVALFKLHPNGNFVWAAAYGGVNADVGWWLDIDTAGNIYTTGTFTGTADFDPSAGTYVLTGVQNSDIYVQKLNQCLKPPAPQNITAYTDMTVCPGNSTTLTVSGFGTVGWYSSATGGTYLGGGNTYTTPVLNATTTFYVQDSLCSASDSLTAITVTVNPAPAIAISVTDTFLCPGDSTILTAVGGITYLWNTTQTTTSITVAPAVTTTYTVSGTGGPGCTVPGTATMTITVYAAPQVSALAVPSSTFCAGDSLTLSGTGASVYSWSGGVSDGQTFLPVATTTYMVIGTDTNGCSDTNTVLITVNAIPAPVANAASTSVCFTAGLVGLTGTPAGGSWSGNGVSGNQFDPQQAGLGTWTATYVYTDSNGCTASDTVNITVNICTGITGATSSPVTILAGHDEIMITNAASAGTVRIYTATGNLIAEFSMSAYAQRTVPVTTAGVYFVRLVSQDGIVTTQPVLITSE